MNKFIYLHIIVHAEANFLEVLTAHLIQENVVEYFNHRIDSAL